MLSSAKLESHTYITTTQLQAEVVVGGGLLTFQKAFKAPALPHFVPRFDDKFEDVGGVTGTEVLMSLHPDEGFVIRRSVLANHNRSRHLRFVARPCPTLSELVIQKVGCLFLLF